MRIHQLETADKDIMIACVVADVATHAAGVVLWVRSTVQYVENGNKYSHTLRRPNKVLYVFTKYVLYLYHYPSIQTMVAATEF